MAKTPHFFKIILNVNDDPIQQGKLVIPKSFLTRYGSYLSEKVFLKVPSGAKWQVDLVKTGADVWFGNGCKHFADYYSVSYGPFLVFGFEDFQNCTFSVLIFDRTTSEIDCPFHVQEEDNDEEPNVDSDMDVIPIQISSEDELESPSSSRPKKKKKKQENNRKQSQAKRGNRVRFAKRTQCFTAEEKANALYRARTSYIPENPSFSIVMQTTYCDRKDKLTIPASFAKKYFREQRGVIILKSAEGKTWSVEYASYRIHKAGRLTMIGSGWKKFVEDNHLAIGDVCVFELINHNASELKVVICRENLDAAKTIPSIGNSKHLKHKGMPFLKEFTSLNPYFIVKLQPIAVVHGLINIPIKFMAKCENRRMEMAQFQVENNVWPVKLLSYSSKCRFSAGVCAFVRDNCLEVGDVCVFELINSESMLLKVSIFRKP